MASCFKVGIDLAMKSVIEDCLFEIGLEFLLEACFNDLLESCLPLEGGVIWSLDRDGISSSNFCEVCTISVFGARCDSVARMLTTSDCISDAMSSSFSFSGEFDSVIDSRDLRRFVRGFNFVFFVCQVARTSSSLGVITSYYISPVNEPGGTVRLPHPLRTDKQIESDSKRTQWRLLESATLRSEEKTTPNGQLYGVRC